MTITPEMVTAAVWWGDHRPQYIISPDSLADRDTYHDADDVEKHAATLVELCGQQHEALCAAMTVLAVIENMVN